MHKQNFFTITLIITGLALNPAMGQTVERRVSYSKVNHSSIVSGIVKVLHNRGLEETAAEELAAELVNEEDGMLLAMLIQSLENQDIVTKDEVLAYLSRAALHKQSMDFKSYDQLIGMVEKIKQKPIDQATRKKLAELAKLNQLLFV
ncbi:MAG: hypothetical protein ABXS92_05825 [Sulfurimonas sp.]